MRFETKIDIRKFFLFVLCTQGAPGLKALSEATNKANRVICRSAISGGHIDLKPI